MKAVAATLGVARSNLVEQLQRPKRPQRGPYRRAEDEAVLGEIRTITDARPTYGYRRVTALLNRARRNAGAPQINHKRVFRLMRYAYLRSHDSGAGREEGIKARPAAIVALLRRDDGRDEVVVFPITSSPPTDAAAGVEIPAATRDRLGLQNGPCWVIVTEAHIHHHDIAQDGPENSGHLIIGDQAQGSDQFKANAACADNTKKS